MSSHRPTEEQQAVIDFISHEKGSLNVDALAGAAKSTTLEMAAPHVKGPALALAFNVSIKKALEERFPDNFTVLTINGLGHRAWMRLVSRKVNVKDYKIPAIIKSANLHGGDLKKRDALRDAVMAAKTYGLVPKDHGAKTTAKSFYPDTPEGWETITDLADITISEEIISHARAILKLSIAEAFEGSIDFADQIYMPCCFSATFPSFPTVFVDEAQDLSPLNHYMLSKSSSGGRVVAVGDERQSIYAFRGADINSIPKLREKFKMDVLSLSTTFRCAQSIVENVLWRAPHMKAAPWAPQGLVERAPSWTLAGLKPDSAVICRNNAPLFSVGFGALAAGIPICFMGKGIEKGLVSVILTAAGSDPACKAELLAGRIEEWRRTECGKAEAIGNSSKSDSINDKAAAIAAIPGANVEQILANLTILLNADSGNITLCTGHKSKGLEFDQVYHLDSNLIGGREGSSEAQQTQEDNLRYVVDTRAKSALTYINRKDLKE